MTRPPISPVSQVSRHRFGRLLVAVLCALVLASSVDATSAFAQDEPGINTPQVSTDTGATFGTDPVAETDTVAETDEDADEADEALLSGDDAPLEFTLDTAQLGLGRNIRLARPAGRTSFTVPTPPGLLLTQLDTTIAVPSSVHQAFVSIAVNGEVIFEDLIDGGNQQTISSQITPVSGDALVEILAEEYAGGQCTSPVVEPTAAELITPLFTFRAQPSLPDTVADFLPQVVETFEIFVDPDRPAHIDEVALLLATNLTTQFPTTPAFRVSEVSDNLWSQIDDDPFTRSIVVRDSATGRVEVRNNGELAYLQLSGPEGLLSDIASSINSPEIRLISSDDVDTLGERSIMVEDLEQRRTLREAGVRNLEASDALRLQLVLPLPQARFGQPVNRIRVRLGGVLLAATAAEVEPVVTLWVNDDLLTTVELDNAGRFDTEFEIVGTDLARENIVLVRSELPIECGFGLPTHELQLDASSWVEVDYGQSLPVSLDRFPQSFLQGFNIRPGQSTADLQVTANLLAVMQSASPIILEPEIASWDEVVSGSLPGIIVGGSPEELSDLNIPISATGGSVDVDGVEFVSEDGYDEIAVLQAIVGPNGQDLLHLQLALADGKQASAEELSGLLNDRGWGQFTGRAFAVNEGNNVRVPADENTSDLALPTLTTEPPAPTRQLFGFGILLAVIFAGLLFAGRSMMAKARGRTRNPVGGN